MSAVPGIFSVGDVGLMVLLDPWLKGMAGPVLTEHPCAPSSDHPPPQPVWGRKTRCEYNKLLPGPWGGLPPLGGLAGVVPDQQACFSPVGQIPPGPWPDSV